ncbi:hypothetical protein [Thalassospira tepidiphila]|jgi:hypothetical protein|uniref:hypothetical protein n=1 Tax=Thalassospira tepidiphila TaxID=393657 RepID=UPI001BD16CCB|nr:hypothetical protein [Thalassospira tepidiphila]
MTAPLVLSLYLEKNRGKKQFVFENFSALSAQSPVLQRKKQSEFGNPKDGRNDRMDCGTSIAANTGE